METWLQVLAFIIFHGDKTKQQKDGRGQVEEAGEKPTMGGIKAG